MKPVEYDVYLCTRSAEDRGMASEVAAGLARLGFRVFVPGREPGSATDVAARLKAIESAPDFVLLSSPGVTEPAVATPDPRAADLAHAFRTKRNIVVLADPADADPLTARDAPDLRGLAAWQRVEYDRWRTRESIALVAYRLESAPEVDDRRLMRFAKRAFAAAGLLLVVAVALKAVPVFIAYWNRPKAPPPLPRFTLYWTAFGQRLQNGQWTAFPVREGSAVAAGDELKLMFSTGSDGYAYVLMRDARGGISALYPPVTLRGASRVRGGGLYQAPGNDRWYPVEPGAGPETIYLFAGHEPLENLEELLEEAESGMTHAARVELLLSTLTGLLDGKHASAPRPVRARGGREIVDSLSPLPPPLVWSATLTGGATVTHQPAVQTGLLSTVVEIRLRSGVQQ